MLIQAPPRKRQELLHQAIAVESATRGENIVCLLLWLLCHRCRQFGSVQLPSSVHFLVTPWTAACQASLSITNTWSLLKLMPMSWWCHPAILSYIIHFSPRLQSFPASGSFPMSRFFPSGGQSIRVSASASVLPMNIQDWFPLEWTDLNSFESKQLSIVFNNTVQKHQFFGTQISW